MTPQQYAQDFMRVINDETWKVYFDTEYAYRFDSTQAMLAFHHSEMGQVLNIMTKAWCALHKLSQDLDSTTATN